MTSGGTAPRRRRSLGITYSPVPAPPLAMGGASTISGPSLGGAVTTNDDDLAMVALLTA